MSWCWFSATLCSCLIFLFLNAEWGFRFFWCTSYFLIFEHSNFFTVGQQITLDFKSIYIHLLYVWFVWFADHITSSETSPTPIQMQSPSDVLSSQLCLSWTLLRTGLAQGWPDVGAIIQPLFALWILPVQCIITTSSQPLPSDSRP